MARMGAIRNTCQVRAGTAEGKSLVGGTRFAWKDAVG